MDNIKRMAYLRGTLKLLDLEIYTALEMPDIPDHAIHDTVLDALQYEGLDWTAKLSECRRALFVAMYIQYGEDALLLNADAVRSAKKGEFKASGQALRKTEWSPDLNQRFRYATQMTNDIWSWRWG